MISALNLPEIDRAGIFPLLNPVFDFAYRNPTNALHLYEYHGRIRMGDQEYEIQPGDITCIQAGTVYSMASEQPGKHWCIHYHDRPMDGEETILLPVHLRTGTGSLYFREQFQMVSRLFNARILGHPSARLLDLQARFRLKALLLSIPEMTMRPPARTGQGRQNFSWNQLLEWVDDHLAHPLSLGQIAERANISPGTLSRKFRDTHGSTFSRYLLHRRIDMARSLLSSTTLTISEVGSAVGIPDPQYFNKQFRKITGISPSRCREESRKQMDSGPALATREGTWNRNPPS